MTWHSIRSDLSLLLSSASLLLAFCSALIARSSLKQAERVAEQERRDWKQRKWFDIYFEANEVYDLLDRFQTDCSNASPTSWTQAQIAAWNNLMHRVRKAHAMPAVFPKNAAIDALFESTKFKDPADALSKQALQKLLGAMEGLRQKALVDTGVLDGSRAAHC